MIHFEKKMELRTKIARVPDLSLQVLLWLILLILSIEQP